MRHGGIGVLIAVASCVSTATITCPDGRVCPAESICEPIHHQCVIAEQLTACDGIADGKGCAFAGQSGLCQDAICIVPACGDGLRSGAEECDGDDRSVSDCFDLGYYDHHDVGCTQSCVYDIGVCTGFCGDGMTNGTEQCDAEPRTPIDDCTSLGYYDHGSVTCSPSCTVDTSACTGFCGDGVVSPGEACEPGGTPVEGCIDYGYDAGALACSAQCTPALASCKHIGWQRYPLGVFDGFIGAYAAAADELFLIAQNGIVTHAKSGSVDQHDLGIALLGIWGSGSGDVWVLGNSGAIERFNGASWVEFRAAPGTFTPIAMGGSSASSVFVVGREPFNSNAGHVDWWNGSAWSSATVGTQPLAGVWVNGNTAYAVGNSGTLATYDGANWTVTAIASVDFDDIWGTSANDIFAVGSTGTILHYNGSGWTPQTCPGTETLPFHAVWGRSSSDVYATAIGTGKICHYDGTTWRALDTGYASTFTALTGSGSSVFAASYNGFVARHSGASWSTTSLPISYVWAGATSATSAAYNGAEVYVPGDTGWTKIHYNSIGYYKALWRSSTAIFVAAQYGQVDRYTSSAWTFESAGLGPYNLQAVWGFADNDVFVAGDGGVIGHYNGSGWQTERSYTAVGTQILGLWGTSSTNLFAVGRESPNAAIYHRDGTGTWSAMTPPAGTGSYLQAISGSSPTNIVAVGASGTVLRYDGTTWTRLPAPTTIDLESVAAIAPDDVFASTYTGAVYHFDGARWSDIRLPATYARSVSGRADMILFQTNSAILALDRPGPW